jgi:hypothetical protein
LEGKHVLVHGNASVGYGKNGELTAKINALGVQLDYIIRAMLDIFEILKPTKFKELIIDFCKPTFAEEKSINEIIFENLYGYLQVLTMRKDNEDIYDLDMELILD